VALDFGPSLREICAANRYNEKQVQSKLFYLNLKLSIAIHGVDLRFFQCSYSTFQF